MNFVFKIIMTEFANFAFPDTILNQIFLFIGFYIYIYEDWAAPCYFTVPLDYFDPVWVLSWFDFGINICEIDSFGVLGVI